MLSLSKFKYSLSQAKKNVIRNGLMSIASLFTTTCCLLIVGLFAIITINVDSITSQIKDQCEVQLYINEDVSDERISAIGDEILALSNVKEISLYTKEQMFEYAMNDVFEGREDLVGAYTEEDNPFSDSYKITLSDISLAKQTVSELEQIADVSHVENNQDVTNMVLSVSDSLQRLSIIIMIILLIASINRRKEINIMKYIGATDRFIRTPFVFEGIMIGFLGAVISFGLISWGYITLYDSFINSPLKGVFDMVVYSDLVLILGGLFIVCGCLIGIVGSSISMRKYLNV